MRMFLSLIVASTLAFAPAIALAQAPTPTPAPTPVEPVVKDKKADKKADKKNKNELKVKCNKYWHVYMKENDIKGKGTGQARKDFQRDCEAGKITPK